MNDVIATVREVHSVCEAQLEDTTQHQRYAKMRAEIANIAIEAEVATLTEVVRGYGRLAAVI